jgi:hypothetical protein
MSVDPASPGETTAFLAARKRRNLWLAVVLLGFAGLVGVGAMVRLGNADLSKGGFYYTIDNAAGTKAAADTDLPPGMTRDQAAPPPNLSPLAAPPAKSPDVPASTAPPS